MDGEPPAQPGEHEGRASPEALREGIRAGIVGALNEEERRTSTLVRRLAAAGAAGIAASVALTLVFAGKTDHAMHLAICGAVWAGLLVECFAFALLRVRTPRIPLGQAAALGLVGLGLASIVALLCPDPHVWNWWNSTRLGVGMRSMGGDLGSALCFGLCSALFLGFGATLVVAWRGGRLGGPTPSAMVLTLLLVPAVILQASDSSVAVMALWGAGIAAGAQLGVGGGLVLASALRRGSQGLWRSQSH